MLFFSQVCIRNKTIRKINKIKNVTLQVRITHKNLKICGKRAFSSICRTQKAVMTIEAALVLPLFLFAMITLMMLFSVMDRQRQIQAALESVCEDISKFAYADYEIKRGGMKVKAPGEEFYNYFTEGAAGQVGMRGYAEIQLRRKLSTVGIRGLSLHNSKILEDEEMIDLVAVYEVELPFPVFRRSGISMTSRSCRRAWIGKDGGWLNGETDQSEEDELVYVGKGSTRYHSSRICHYLYNQVTKVSWEEVQQRRNTYGGKYSACVRCGGAEGQAVYIMPAGSSYHSTTACTAISAYVKAVKKSEVESLGACSYCSGGGG